MRRRQRTGADACHSNVVTNESARFNGEADATNAQTWYEKKSEISYPCY